MLATLRRKREIKTGFVNVIGCGFAGIECALFLAEHGVNVHVFDCKKSGYRCNCPSCEVFGVDEENQAFARDLLRSELRILGSGLIEKEDELLQKDRMASCVADKLLSYGLEKVKNHPKIEYFQLCVTELNLKEINVIASGPHTDSKLFEYLKNLHGSMRLFDTYNLCPVVDNIKEEDFSIRNDELFMPLDYQSYISLCNRILNEIVPGQKLGQLEELAKKEKDGLKNTVMRPVFIDGLEEKPYACIKLKKLRKGYEIEGFSSALPPESQYKIITSIKGLENAIILRSGKVIENHYINAPFVINHFSQSTKFENLFYAGNISGVFGHIESMASGLYVGYNLLNYIAGKGLKALPKASGMGSLIDKVICSGAIKNEPKVSSYDDIMTDRNFKTIKGKSKHLFEESEKNIKKFKEEVFGGKFI